MKKPKKWLCFSFVFLLLILNSIIIYAEENDEDSDDKTLAPYFFIENAGSSADQFPLKGTNVSTTINGVIAEIYVTQTYANEGENPINAQYVFPASTKVAVHGMKMEIGNQVITAQIKEKEEAKEEFEEAKSEGKSASLLEQKRSNVFTMSVANIMPGDTVRIELHYTELLSPTEGIYQFVFPTVVGPRYASSQSEQNKEEDGWAASPYLPEGGEPSGAYDISVQLSTGVPITDISCKSHQIQVSRDGEANARIGLADPEDFAGDRDFILNYKLTGEEISYGMMLNSGEEENFFMLMVQPPERYKPEDLPPREYIFVLDVSGSMFGYPLDTAKDLIRSLVGSLEETDQFNVILFSTETRKLSSQSLPATDANIQKAVELIEQQEGGGGTELAPALKEAVSIPSTDSYSRSIVTITDGYLTGESEIFRLINQHLDEANFFSFGIGTSVNRHLIEGIAKTGLGEAFIVTDSEDAKDTANRFRTYIQAPVLTDIQIQYSGFEAYDVEPPVTSTLFAQRPIVVFGKWKGEPAGTVQITGKSGNTDYSQDISVSDLTPSNDCSAVPYLWARTKVERLTDYGSSESFSDDIKQQVTQLGLDYSLLTPYTSFIAVTDVIRNTEGNSQDVSQPLPLPSQVSNLAVGGYTVGSEPGMTALIGAAVLAVFFQFILQQRKKAGKTD